MLSHASIIANLNVDGGNVLGRTRSFRVLGEDKSSLGPSFRRLIAPNGLRTAPDEHPERGYFYRSDHFAFAKAGIPAVSIPCGLSEGLPVGLQLVGPAFSETRILDAAHALEAAIGFEGVPRP